MKLKKLVSIINTDILNYYKMFTRYLKIQTRKISIFNNLIIRIEELKRLLENILDDNVRAYPVGYFLVLPDVSKTFEEMLKNFNDKKENIQNLKIGNLRVGEVVR